MRICLCSIEVAGFRGGGIGTYVVEAGRALTGAGHEVWLLTTDPGPGRREELQRHPAFTKVLFVADAAADWRGGCLRADEAYRHAAQVHEALQACGQQFDYIEFPDYGAEGYVALREAAASGAYGKTVLGVTLHSPTWEIYGYNQQLHLMKTGQRELCALEDDAIRAAPLLCSPSIRLLELVTARLGLPADRGHIVRYPMVLPDRSPAPPAPRGALTDVRMLYFGRIEPRKGVHRLIEAFAAVPEASIELIGRDATYSPYGGSYLEWLAPRLPDNVKVLPPMPREQLLQRIAEVDVCVLPSVWDNWPNACIEAMAAGRVVIGGRDGGMGEMIEHGRSGFLVDGDDPADIARVLRDELGGALDRLDQIGAAAAARIRELSAPSRYVASLERLVEASRGGPARAAGRAPTVSAVVTGAVDRPELVAATVAALRAQTSPVVEILVIGAERSRDEGEVRFVGVPGGANEARNCGLDLAGGDAVLFLDAGDRPAATCVAACCEALALDPDLAGVVPDARRHDPGSPFDQQVLNTLPFEWSLCLSRPGAPEIVGMFRVAPLRARGVRFDPLLDLVAARAIRMDCAAAGLAVASLPRVLIEHRVADGAAGHRPWEHHVAQLGQLVDRHLPSAASAAISAYDRRRLLLAVVQAWGPGAMLSPFGEVMHRLDAVLMQKTPRLARWLRRLAARALSRHGRRKARRSGFSGA